MVNESSDVRIQCTTEIVLDNQRKIWSLTHLSVTSMTDPPHTDKSCGSRVCRFRVAEPKQNNKSLWCLKIMTPKWTHKIENHFSIICLIHFNVILTLSWLIVRLGKRRAQVFLVFLISLARDDGIEYLARKNRRRPSPHFLRRAVVRNVE